MTRLKDHFITKIKAKKYYNKISFFYDIKKLRIEIFFENFVVFLKLHMFTSLDKPFQQFFIHILTKWDIFQKAQCCILKLYLKLVINFLKLFFFKNSNLSKKIKILFLITSVVSRVLASNSRLLSKNRHFSPKLSPFFNFAYF